MQNGKELSLEEPADQTVESVKNTVQRREAYIDALLDPDTCETDWIKAWAIHT